ncbi:MAG TPA: ATP-binding protein [Verrucomicrobiae bacterium]
MKPVVLISALVLALTMGLSTWIYLKGAQAMREQAKAQGLYIYREGAQTPQQTGSGNTIANDDQKLGRLLKQVDDWALKVTLSTAAGGAGLMLVVVLGFVWWRHACLDRMAKRTAELQANSNKLNQIEYEVQRLTNERRRLEAELRQANDEVEKRVVERTATLSRTYAQLEAELNERKHAERALAQQAQELERSKDVLELHVQARTQELQKLQRRYEHILNSAGEGIYGLDMQGKTTFVNPAAAKITGRKVEEMIGKLETEIFYHLPPGSPMPAESKPNGEHQNEQIFHRKDGNSFPVEYVRTPILEKDKPVGAVVIFKDITERKRTEDALARKAAELARSNSELEQFAYVASHDLQEPLRKIQAFGDRLKTKCDAVQLQDGRDYLERMQSAAARMQTLINDLLTFSRVISTTQPFVPVDLGQVTREVLTDLEVRIEQTKAKIEVGELATIDADPLQMRQLLQNLIGNALKFQTPDAQPVVKISAQTVKKPFGTGGETEPSDEVCELQIQDNGIGFDEKYSDKIFAVFQRLHGRTEYEGTGVGLAVCRRITDRHGGSIHAQSKPGEGATFVVTLPVKHPQPPATT